MKSVTIAITAAFVCHATAAESILSPLNEKIPGEFSGRLQMLGIYRDFDHGNNGHKTTLGAVLGYDSPEVAGFDFGAAYHHAFTLFDGGNASLPLNDDISLLNEGWLRYHPEAAGLEGTSLTAGRKISNGEVFREDDYRQKARSIESIQIQTTDIDDLSLTAGHAIRLSNWIDASDRWDFNDFGDVFGTGYDTDGISWIEGTYTGLENWEIAAFNAYAWDVTNLIGLRVKVDFCDEASLTGYYRHEGDVGKAGDQDADAFGLSYTQKVGGFTIEPGYFGVFGDDLRFQEATTGINHPLGVSMLICSCQFNGGAHTAYLKASGKVGDTVLYALYNHTWQEKAAIDGGHELNVVVKQPICDSLSVSLKGALGYQYGGPGPDTTFTDGRVFLTYTF